jgi:hypothetical protein
MTCSCQRTKTLRDMASPCRVGSGASAPELRDGIRLYRAFNQFRPSHVSRIRHARLMPAVVVQLGELIGLIYRSDKWQSGSPRTFIHFMEDPPRLVCDPPGTQLYVVGGSYRVSARGIEG